MIENKLNAEVLGLGWTFSWMDQKSKNEERICAYNKNLKPTFFYHEKKMKILLSEKVNLTSTIKHNQ